MWNEKISGTRKLTTLHLNPKNFTTGRSKGLESQIRSVLFSPIFDAQNQPRLQALPDQIAVHVMAFLSAKEVCRSGRSCRRLREVYRNELVWRPKREWVLEELRRALGNKRLRRRSQWGPLSVETELAAPSPVLAGEPSDKPSYEVYREADSEIKV